jgi:hypothetical protein
MGDLLHQAGRVIIVRNKSITLANKEIHNKGTRFFTGLQLEPCHRPSMERYHFNFVGRSRKAGCWSSGFIVERNMPMALVIRGTRLSRRRLDSRLRDR